MKSSKAHLNSFTHNSASPFKEPQGCSQQPPVASECSTEQPNLYCPFRNGPTKRFREVTPRRGCTSWEVLADSTAFEWETLQKAAAGFEFSSCDSSMGDWDPAGPPSLFLLLGNDDTAVQPFRCLLSFSNKLLLLVQALHNQFNLLNKPMR